MPNIALPHSCCAASIQRLRRGAAGLPVVVSEKKNTTEHVMIQTCVGDDEREQLSWPAELGVERDCNVELNVEAWSSKLLACS